MVYAIAGGNTCILKGSELSPRCWWAIGSVLTEAGLPKGVLNVLVHKTEDAPEVTRVLIQHPAVRKVNFTGSTATGRIVAELAGKALKPVLLELGGKAPAIVLKDANLEEAAKWVAIGGLLHAGQICMSTERAIVERECCEGVWRAIEKSGRCPKPAVWRGEGIDQRSWGGEEQKAWSRMRFLKEPKILTGDVEIMSTKVRRACIRSLSKVWRRGWTSIHTESFGPTFQYIYCGNRRRGCRIGK